jgi:hypothetical protein
VFAKSLRSKIHYDLRVQDDDQDVSTFDLSTTDQISGFHLSPELTITDTPELETIKSVHVDRCNIS